MNRLTLCLAIAIAATCFASTASAGDLANRIAVRHARGLPWHGNYYHTTCGAPVSLVVPPTSHMQVKWGWGVAQSETRPIYHQFHRAYPGDRYGGGSALLPTPQWPSHTDQFGVYYVRGPW